jgi:hypothetical protein
MSMRSELLSDDLDYITEFLRQLKPKIQDLVCTGVELHQPNDRSVVFHILRKNDEGSRESSIVLISAQLILDMIGENEIFHEKDA